MDTHNEPSTLSECDEEQLIRALAATMRRLKDGVIHPGGLTFDLLYSINPYSSLPANAFLCRVAMAYDKLPPDTRTWGQG